MSRPFLLLSQFVYARRQDGIFYPAIIEGKEIDNSYTIQFPDHTKAKRVEDDLIWLGFYGLTPNCWPRSPIVKPVLLSDKDATAYGLEDKEYNSYSAHRPDSLRILKNNAKTCLDFEPKKMKSETSPEEFECGEDRAIENSDAMDSHLNAPPLKQRRSSVLRINQKALWREASQKHDKERRNSPSIEDFSPKTTAALSLDQLLQRQDDLESIDAVDEEEVSAESRGIHHPNASFHSGNPAFRYDWYDRHFPNPTCPTPPTTPGSLPSPPGELPSRLYACNPFNASDFGQVWTHVNSVSTLGGRRRRRDNMKKCRKVYGIDNRHLWCTQCKWKKACTRFQIGSSPY